MKKYLLIVILLSFVLLGCSKRNDITKIDINTITDLPTLQNVITQVSEEMNKGTITMEQAQTLVEQLQQKYVDLTDITDTGIENTFATIQKTFDGKAITLYSLPLWAKKLGMILPKGMTLNKVLSYQKDGSGYASTILVYTGAYATALQQAEIIAQKAHLSVSKNFQQAQAIAKSDNVDYISGLDLGNLSKGIVYINHELLDTNIDNLLSVSVDQEGVLTIETTKTN